jgi:CubicO group peptidase (beta-lactamase class C family)
MRRPAKLAATPAMLCLWLLVAALPAETARAEPMAIDAARIDAAFAGFDKPGSPGCAVGIVWKGALVHAKGHGLASLEHGVPITPETVFDLGSTSKQVTAAAVGLLALDGRLSLDDDIRKTLPEIPDYGTRITIRHLLTHTSGLRDYTDLLSLSGKREEDVTTASDALAVLARQRGLNFPPGSEYRYCNSGFFLASVIVERVSGRTLREFARERLFRPLGMTRTDFLDDHTQVVPGRAAGYAPKDGGGFRVAMSDWEQVGDGSVQSSVADVARWAESFETGKAGGRKLAEMLETPGRLADGTPLEYGLGLSIGDYRGQRMISHGGAWAGYRAMLMRFPSQRLAVVTLCNVDSADTTTLSLAAADAALDALGLPAGAVAGAPPPPGKGSPPESAGGTARLAGVFVNEHLGEVVRLTASGEGLRLGGLGSPVQIVPEAPGRAGDADRERRFASTDGRIRARFGTDGSNLTRAARSLGPRAETFARAEPGDGRTPPDFPPDATGDYGSPELGASLSVALEKGAFLLKVPTGETSALVRLSPDLYECDFGLVRFARDPRGHVTSLALTNRGLAGFVLPHGPGRP